MQFRGEIAGKLLATECAYKEEAPDSLVDNQQELKPLQQSEIQNRNVQEILKFCQIQMTCLLSHGYGQHSGQHPGLLANETRPLMFKEGTIVLQAHAFLFMVWTR